MFFAYLGWGSINIQPFPVNVSTARFDENKAPPTAVGRPSKWPNLPYSCGFFVENVVVELNPSNNSHFENFSSSKQIIAKQSNDTSKNPKKPLLPSLTVRAE